MSESKPNPEYYEVYPDMPEAEPEDFEEPKAPAKARKAGKTGKPERLGRRRDFSDWFYASADILLVAIALICIICIGYAVIFA